MKKIEIDDLSFLAEIHWVGVPENQKISEYIKDNDIQDKKGFVINPPSKDFGTPLIGFYGNEKIGNLKSILGIITNANRKLNKEIERDGGLLKNWVVILKIDDVDKYWCCVIKDGMPFLRQINDAVLDFDDIVMGIDEITEILSANDESEFNIISNEDNNKILALAEDLGLNVTHIDLVDLVKKNKSIAKLKTLKTNKVLPIIVIIFFVGAFGFYKYQQGIEEEEEINRNKILQQQQEEQRLNEIKKYMVEYEIAKKESINNSIKMAETNLNDLLSTHQVNNILKSWLNILYNIPLDHIGWKLTNINCSIQDTVPYCDVFLQREMFGINKLLLDKYGSLDVKINGNTANYTIKANSEINSINANYKNLTDDKYFIKNIMSNFEIINIADINYNVENASEITYPIMLPNPPLGVNQDTNIQPIMTGVSKGQYNLDGNGLWQIKGLIPYLKDNSLGINNLNIDFSGDITESNWKLNGEYYIKTRDEMIIPQIPEATIGLSSDSFNGDNDVNSPQNEDELKRSIGLDN